MRRALVLVTCLAALVSCTGSPGAAPPAGSGVGGAGTSASEPGDALDDLAGGRYVALGDSFTAAPLVPVTRIARGCFRSDANYPALLAESLGLRLRDVSCSGATTRHLVRQQPTVQGAGVGPQLRVVDHRAQLVTLGVGGNDLGLFGRLLRTCLDVRRLDPDGAPCAESDTGRRMLAATPTIGAHVERAVERVRRRAPEARVVLVGYPRIAPSVGTCPARLPFARGDVAFGDRVLRALDGALRDAADATGVDYLDMYAASEGHDVCSDDPWVNGQQTQAGLALAFHPLAAGMRAVATELEALLATP
jgi:lysophospholipase L1-like esterase